MTIKQPQLTVSCLQKKHNQESLDSDTFLLQVDQVLSSKAQET